MHARIPRIPILGFLRIPRAPRAPRHARVPAIDARALRYRAVRSWQRRQQSHAPPGPRWPPLKGDVPGNFKIFLGLPTIGWLSAGFRLDFGLIWLLAFIYLDFDWM